jgi:hypothetical protein
VFRSWDIIRNLDGVGLNTRVDDIHDRGTWAVNIEVPSIGVHRSEEPASPAGRSYSCDTLLDRLPQDFQDMASKLG